MHRLVHAQGKFPNSTNSPSLEKEGKNADFHTTKTSSIREQPSPGQVYRQRAGALQQSRTIAAFDVLHEHAEMVPRLERAVERHHERIVGHRQDIALGKHLQNTV